MKAQRINRSTVMQYDLIIPYHLIVLALAAYALLESIT